MDKNFIPIIVFALITVLIAFKFHQKIKKPVKASIYSALSASFVYQLFAAPDAFFIGAFILGFGIAFVISLFVGIPFEYIRRKEINEKQQQN